MKERERHMLDKNELLKTYNESKNKQTEKMQQLRESYIEPMIDEKLIYAAKNAKTHIEINIIAIVKTTVHNKSNMYIDDNIIIHETKNLIEDYAKVVTIDNIDDLKYIFDEPNKYKNYVFVIDKELYDQQK